MNVFSCFTNHDTRVLLRNVYFDSCESVIVLNDTYYAVSMCVFRLKLHFIMVYILPGPQICAGMASLCVFFGLVTLSHAYAELNLLIQFYEPFDVKEKIK